MIDYKELKGWTVFTYKQLKDLNYEVPGIYFLTYRTIPIYLGESKNVRKRLETHRRNGLPADRIYAIGGIDYRGARLFFETILIHKYQPVLNRTKAYRQNQGKNALSNYEKIKQIIENASREASYYDRYKWQDKVHNFLLDYDEEPIYHLDIK